MTKEEELEKIKKRICCEYPVQHFCTDACMSGKEYCEFAMAIESLEKQIPKKPNRANHGRIINGIPTMLDEDEFWKCPSCLYYDVILRQNQSYCHKCGQMIDWSDVD